MEPHIGMRGDHGVFSDNASISRQDQAKTQVPRRGASAVAAPARLSHKIMKAIYFPFEESTLVQCVQTTEYEVDTKAISTA